MAKRKLDTKRLYKLVEILVNVVISFSLIVSFIYFAFGLSMRDRIFEEAKECDQHFRGSTKVMRDLRLECVGDYLQESRMTRYIAWGGLGISISLAILFYGGTWLFKYLFPQRKDD